MPQSEKQLEALVRNQYGPGETGNAGGRPKTKPLSDALRALLAGDAAKWAKVPEPTQTFVKSMFEDAVNGCAKSRSIIFDRVEGALPKASDEKELPIVEFILQPRKQTELAQSNPAPHSNGKVIEVEAEPVE